MLSDTLVRLLADRHGIETRNHAAYGPQGYSLELWRELAEMGVIGALISPDDGGYGGEGFDIAVVFEALGGALATEPFLGALLGGRILHQDERHAPLIEGVIAGVEVLALAHQEADASLWDRSRTTARRSGDGWVLNGAKAVVAHAEAATWLIVSATLEETAERALFLISSKAEGLSVRGYNTIDGGRASEVMLQDVTATDAALIASGEEADRRLDSALAAGLLALSAEALGAMERIKVDTLEYLRSRVQFGTPIGSFQALQHRMATVLLEIEQARSSVINAGALLQATPLERDRTASAAKFTVGRVGALAAEEAVQMHGGIGMTWELPMAHYAKRVLMIDQQMGDQDAHLARFMGLERPTA